MKKSKISTKMFISLLIIALLFNYVAIFNSSYATIEKAEEVFKNAFSSIVDEEEDLTDLVITTVDAKNNEITLPNAKYAIRKVAEGTTNVYELPTDPKGNTVGTEEIIDGNICRTFITDENGEIRLNLANGKYLITQISTEDGYHLNEENSYVVDVNQIGGVIFEGTFNKYSFVESENEYYNQYPEKFLITDLSDDGYAIFSSNGRDLFLIDGNGNTLSELSMSANKRKVEGYTICDLKQKDNIFYVVTLDVVDNPSEDSMESISEIFKYEVVDNQLQQMGEPIEINELSKESQITQIVLNENNISYMEKGIIYEEAELDDDSIGFLSASEPKSYMVYSMSTINYDGTNDTKLFYIPTDAYYSSYYFNNFVEDEDYYYFAINNKIEVGGKEFLGFQGAPIGVGLNNYFNFTVLNELPDNLEELELNNHANTCYSILKILKETNQIEKLQEFGNYFSTGLNNVSAPGILSSLFGKINMDENGNIYYSIVGNSSIELDNTKSGEEISINPSSNLDSTIFKLDSDLLIDWAVQIGDSSLITATVSNFTFADEGILLTGTAISPNKDGEFVFVSDETENKYEIRSGKNEAAGNDAQASAFAIKINEDGKIVFADTISNYDNTFNGELGRVIALEGEEITYLGNNKYFMLFKPQVYELGNSCVTSMVLTEKVIRQENKEVGDLLVPNEKDVFDVVTEAKTTGGSISGMDDDIYEEVEYGENTTKEIVVTPDPGYKISYIKVNGEEIEFTPEEDGSFRLSLFANVMANIRIEVGFDPDNTQTKEISYTVKYYKDNVLQEDDTDEVKKEVYILDEDSTINVDMASINIKDKYEGYVFEKTFPENIPTKLGDGDVIQVFYTARNDLSYTINFLDSETKEEIQESKTIENQTYLSEIEVENLVEKIKGYTFSSSDKDTLIIGLKDNEINLYYNAKLVNVNVHHVDMNTNKELRLEMDTVKFGRVYNAIAVDIDEYELIERPEEENIKINELNDIEITYYYAHVSDGTLVKHIDKATGALLSNELIEGYEGKEYETLPEVFANYDLDAKSLPVNAEGKMAIELTEVRYYYLKQASVRVKYLNDDSKGTILTDLVINGHEGDEYTTEQKDFGAYDFVRSEGNTAGKMAVTVNADGTFNSETVVKYYYKKTSTTPIIYNNNYVVVNGEAATITAVNTTTTKDGNVSTNSNQVTTTTGKSITTNGSSLPKTGDDMIINSIACISIIVLMNIAQVVVDKKIKTNK